MEHSSRQHLVKLRTTYQRRLEILEEQAAAFGSQLTPPHILMEIADLIGKIEELDTKLGRRPVEHDFNPTRNQVYEPDLSVERGTTAPADSTDHQASKVLLPAPYNLAAIRDLLCAAFDTEELRGLFYFAEMTELRAVVNQFAVADSLPAMVRKAVRYCDSRGLLEEMLAEVARGNPHQYERFESALYTAKPE